MCFFFFKQRTAYEMRISDLSSDVCYSDLQEMAVLAEPRSEPADLPHQPLVSLYPAAHILRQEHVRLLGQIDEDRPALENRDRRAAVCRGRVDNGDRKSTRLNSSN